MSGTSTVDLVASAGDEDQVDVLIADHPAPRAIEKVRGPEMIRDEDYWACVDGVVPDRGQRPVKQEAIPVAVVRTLVNEVHLPEAEVRAMTKAQAMQRLTHFYTTGAWNSAAPSRPRVTP